MPPQHSFTPAPADQPSPFELFVIECRKRLAPQDAGRVTLANERELKDWAADMLGVVVPAKRVCRGHRAPLEAMADAYFAVYPRTTWKASRGFGGKTVLLGALAVCEAVTLGAAVTLLGGSGQQSKRVHDYMRGEGGMRGRFWRWPRAPIDLLTSDPTATRTRLTNGGDITALMASGKSVRGPHPQRVRGDEIDEMHPDIWRSAQGQAMEAFGIKEQTLGSSTLHHPNGTMAAELLQAAEQGWPVYEWCYRETTAAGGFATLEQVVRKQKSVDAATWKNEFELQEPSVSDRAIDTEAVDLAFDPDEGHYGGGLDDVLQLEKPEKPAEDGSVSARYATGVDLGKRRDKTIIWTVRCDRVPARLVAYTHVTRMPWPMIDQAVEWQAKAYPGVVVYDAGGMGTDYGDRLSVKSVGFNLNGLQRTNLFREWISAIENGEFKAPRIDYAHKEHRYVTWGDLFGRGEDKGHPPDTFVAAALAWKAANAPGLALV